MGWISNIKEFFIIIEEWNLAQYFIVLKDFYFYPKRFWNKYNRLSSKNKTYQFLTYFAIFVIVILGFKGYTIANLFKLLTQVVSLTLITTVLFVGFYLSKTDTKGIKNIVIYSCYYLFLLFPLELIFWTAYEITGDYHILFIHNIVYVLLDLFLWFAPVFIFITDWKKRIITILTIFITLNTAEVVIYPMRSNDSSFTHNYIGEERYELGKTIKNAYIIPYCVVTNKNNTDLFYLYSGPTDSIAWKVDTKQYFEDLEKDMDLLKTISKQCEYDENKIFFSRLFEIRRGIAYCHQNQQYSNKITKETIVADSEGRELDRYIYRLFNEDIMALNNELLETDIRDAEAYELSLYPLNVSMWIRPALILAIKYGNHNKQLHNV